MMPGMDGYDTMRAIRELDQFKTVPIIAVTGKVVPGERQRCIDAGRQRLRPQAGEHRRAHRGHRAVAPVDARRPRDAVTDPSAR